MIGVYEAAASKRFSPFGQVAGRAFGAACILAAITLNGFTLREYFRRDAEYTVYKPNPDWRSATHYFEQEINQATGPLAMFAVVPPLEMTYYNPRFRNIWLGVVEGQGVLTGEDARQYWGIYSIGPEPMKYFHDALAKTGARVFYLIHNRFWSGGAPRVFKEIMQDPKFQLQTMQAYKGIEIYKVGVCDRAN
jgi:hypothetical protein